MRNNFSRDSVPIFSRRFIAGIFMILVVFPVMLLAQDKHEHIKCGWGTLPPPYQTQTGKESVTELSQARQSRTNRYLANVDGYAFLLHYDTDGSHAIPGEIDSETGLPVWIIETEAALQRVWHLLVDSLGFDPPPMDQTSYAEDPAGGAYDIYFTDMFTYYGASYYGYTWPESPVENTAPLFDYSAYLEIENDFAGFPTIGVDALHVTIAHELFHLFHMGYVWKLDVGYQGSTDIWWYEISSSWFEDVAYPDVNDYVNYVEQYFNEPKAIHKGGGFSENSLPGYRSSHYGYILASYSEPDLLEDIWSRFRERDAYSAIDRALRTLAGSTLANSLKTFAAWNFYTGENAIAGYGYPDAAIYPVITTDDNIVIPGGLPYSISLGERDIRYFDAIRESGSQPYFNVHLQGQSATGDVSGVFGLTKNTFAFDFLESGSNLDIVLENVGENGHIAAVNSDADSGGTVLGISEEFIRPYPNPLVLHNGQQTLRLHTFLMSATTIQATMYNIRAQQVYQYNFNGTEYETGTQFLEMPLSSNLVSNLANGIYLIHLQGRNLNQTAKITVLR